MPRKLRKKEKQETVRSISRRCRGPRLPVGDRAVSEAFAAGDLEQAAMMDALHREPCGADINDLILEFPLDGEPKAAPCYGCGRTVEWTPANLDAVRIET